MIIHHSSNYLHLQYWFRPRWIEGLSVWHWAMRPVAPAYHLYSFGLCSFRRRTRKRNAWNLQHGQMSQCKCWMNTMMIGLGLGLVKQVEPGFGLLYDIPIVDPCPRQSTYRILVNICKWDNWPRHLWNSCCSDLLWLDCGSIGFVTDVVSRPALYIYWI